MVNGAKPMKGDILVRLMEVIGDCRSQADACSSLGITLITVTMTAGIDKQGFLEIMDSHWDRLEALYDRMGVDPRPRPR